MPSNEEQVTELANKLTQSLDGLNENSSYYEAEHRLKAIGVSTPPEMRELIAQVGWPRTYLDSMEERLDLEGFRMAGQSKSDDRMWDWWEANDMGEESGLGHLEGFIHGRAYATASAPDPNDPTQDPDTPVFRVESPRDMWAEIDPRSRKVDRAIRLYRNPAGVTNGATLFLPNETVILEKGTGYNPWTTVHTIEHSLGMVPVVPILNRERLEHRNSGSSEIFPELRSITDAAARTMMNMQATAELMAVPQRLLFGVAREALATNPDDPGSALESYFARILAFEDSDGHATQFSAAELRNFVEVLQELSKQAASYTGLPPQYLSFSSENPASAEAIRSSESRLVKKCERKARMFGGAWEQLMRLGMLIIDGEIPKEAYRMESVWRDPSTPTYAAKADAVSKLVSTISADGRPIIPIERARIDLGYSEEERLQMKQMDKDSPTSQLSSLYGPGPRSIPSPQPGDDTEEEVPA